MLLIRMLDTESMGAYFIAFIVTALLVLLSDFGVDIALVKKYPEKDEGEQTALLRSAVIWRFFVCALVSVLYFALSTVEGVPMIRDIAHITAPVIVFYWLQSFRALLLRALQAQHLFDVYAGTQLLAAALKVILIAALFVAGTDSVAIVLWCECATFFASIVYALARMQLRIGKPAPPSLGDALELLRFGFPLYLNALVNLGNERAAGYVVAGLGGPVAMAYFGVAERLADAGRRLFDPFGNVYLPAQTKYFADGDIAAAKEFANRSLLWVTFIVAGGTIAFAVIREPVIGLLFTQKYISVADTAVFFMCALVLRCIQVLLGYFGVAAGFNYMPVKVSLLSSVIGIALILLFFTWYGYQGAVIALVITQAMIGTMYVIGLHRGGVSLDITPVVVLLSGFAAALSWILPFDHLWFVAAGAPLFFLVFSLMFVPTLRSDLAIVFDKVRRNGLAERVRQQTAKFDR